MRSLLEAFFNLFRKNKRYVFHPDCCCSGTGPAVYEFNRFKEDLEKATGYPVRMVSANNFFGYSYIIYEVIYKEEQER